MTRRGLLIGLALTLAGCPRGGGGAHEPTVGDDGPGVSLVVGQGNANVRDRRRVELAAHGEVVFAGVARELDARTVRMRSLDDPGGTEAVEQAFDDTSVAPAGASLDAAIGKQVRVRRKSGELRGKLIARTPEGLVIEADDGTPTVIAVDGALLGVDVEGAPAPAPATGHGPALSWQVTATRPGAQLLEASYQTTGLTWSAEYAIVIDDAGERAEVTAMVSIDNHSGADFERAQVVLARGGLAPGTPAGTASAREPKLFPLTGPVTLRDRTITPVALLPPRVVAARRVLVYDAIGPDNMWRDRINTERDFPAGTTRTVTGYLEVANTAEEGLGVTLPAGTIRFFQRGKDGRLSFLGSRQSDDMAAGERLRIPLGDFTGVVGERRQVDFDVDDELRRVVEEIEITVDNNTDQAREVVVLERMARYDWWRLTWYTAAGDKDDKRSVRFTVKVPAHGQQKLRYRVIYRW